MTGRAWGLFAAVSILWGVPYLLIKIVSPHLSAPALAWARVAIAAALLLPLACGLRVLPALRGSWHRVAVVGIIEIAAPFTLIAHGEHQVDSSTAGILIATEPILVAVLALQVDASERATRTNAVGLLVGMSGVVLLLGFGGPGRIDGAAAILLASLCYAAGALLIKAWFAGLPPLAPVAGALTVSALVLLPAALATRPAHAPPPGVLSAVVGLGVGCTALGFLAFFALVRHVGAARGSLVAYVAPLVAVTAGAVALDEPVTPGRFLGLGLVLAGSGAASSRPSHSRHVTIRRVPSDAAAPASVAEGVK